ncbi:MAG: hypothetical protein HQM09_09660 [Candidatus Riflebacteria bacterium]|nr:hypothetical protein [Candidatus Riflebacteria bacterium]
MEVKISGTFTTQSIRLIVRMFCVVILALPAAAFSGTLPWPFRVPFFVAARAGDFQNYADVPYFHGGTDIGVHAGAEVFTPVSGTVDISTYYIDASRTPLKFNYLRTPFRGETKEKHAATWSKMRSSSGDRYVEIAITTANGLRWMFRHIDAATIPQRVIDLDGKGIRINAGDKIGEIIPWSESVYPEKRRYDHLHLEITDADGWYVNPETQMTSLPDTHPPDIKGIWFVPNEAETAFMPKNGSSMSDPPVVSGDIDIVAEIDDTIDGSRYLSTPFLIQASISRITATGPESIAPLIDIFRFDKLPIKGDRTQLVTTVYKEHLRIGKTEAGSQGNSHMRVFYFILTNGDVLHGYNSERCIRTTGMADGRYIVNVFATDTAGNRSGTSQEFIIRNMPGK